MATGKLTIDLDALVQNWRALAALDTGETAAVVKADGYGLGIARVARALAHAGVRRYFVAVAEEGATLRQILGPGPEINVMSGHMPGDTDMIGDLELTPMINSYDQLLRHLESLPGASFGIQLDTGMNRLGMEAAEWAALRDIAVAQKPTLIMSHLACSDAPDHPMNRQQLDQFRAMTEGLQVPRSLAATGGILLGKDYHFEVSRPGIGLYGGRPFEAAAPVVRLDLPVIQIRDLEPGETVGYGNTWTATDPTRVATVSGGYADGIHRILTNRGQFHFGATPCAILGRVSMDLIGIDVTHLGTDPAELTLIGEHQTIDDVADIAQTIGYEILTSLGGRYDRRYSGG